MNILKKISAIFIFTILIFISVFSLSSCKKGDLGKDNGNGNNDVLFIVSEDTYKNAVKTDYRGNIESISTLSDVAQVNENKTYYAVLRIPGKNFKKAKFSLEGDVVYQKALKMIQSVYTSQYNKTENAFYIERKYDTGNNYFYAAIEFEVSQSYSGIPVTAKFEYTDDAESETFESVVKNEKEIQILRGAETVSHIGYLTESDYMSGDYEDKIKESIEVAKGEKCYVVIDYTLSEETKITETDTASIIISAGTFSDILGFNFEVEALPTGNYVNTGDSIEATFKIHDSVGDGKKFRFIVCVSGESTGEIIVGASIKSRGIFFVGGYQVSGTVNVSADLEVESKLSYTLSQDGTYYTVTGLGQEFSDTVTVPSIHEGLPVKAIESFVFREAKHIKSVILNDGLEKIGARSFENCTSLKSIVIPSSVTEIGNNAFNGCTAAVICCEAAEKPDGWSETWVNSDAEVTWDSDNRYITSDGGKTYSYKHGAADEESVTVLDEYKNRPVIGILDNAFEGCTELKTVTLPSGITVIGEKAFYGCTGIIEILIPESVETIGESAFMGCTSLETVTFADDSMITELPESVFSGCASLKNVIFEGESNLNTIAASAFSGCTALTEITVLESVQKIEEKAFFGCTGLKTVIFAEESVCESIGDEAFSGCTQLNSVTLPDGMKYIKSSAFEGCVALTDIVIPKSVQTLGNNVFKGCVALKTVTFTDAENSSLVSIGDHAFSDCTVLSEITLPKYLETLGNSAFESCIGLESVTFLSEGRLNSIGDNAFYKCSSLTEISIPRGISTIGSGAFAQCTELKAVTIGEGLTTLPSSIFTMCEKLETVTLPNSVVIIKENAFYRCTALKSVTIPDKVTEIGAYAFEDCTSLKTVTVGCKVEAIKDRAFYGCIQLDTLTFTTGSMLRTIGYYAFYNCTSLKSITIPEGVTQITPHAFDNCTGLTEIIFNAFSCNDLTFNNYAFANAGAAGEGITVTFGRNVQKIPAYLFYPYTASNEYVPNIKTVTIDRYVESIGKSAFYNCTSLTTVTIYSTVPFKLNTIGDYVFYNCTALTTINFHGAETLWTAVTKGTRWDEYVSGSDYLKLGYTVIYKEQ